MMEGADAEAKAKGATLMTAAGAFDGDNEGTGNCDWEYGQRWAWRVSWLPLTMPKLLFPAIKKAQDAGVMVIALDSPLQPKDASDALFATNNFVAGELIGKYCCGCHEGQDRQDRDPGCCCWATPVAVLRHNWFHEWLWPCQTRWHTATDYVMSAEIVCSGRYQWRTRLRARPSWKTAWARTPDINVVYTINEPAAAGAYTRPQKLQAKRRTFWSSPSMGGCTGVENVAAGKIAGYPHSSTPLVMASMGVDATIEYATSGKKASGYTDTGVTLISDKPMTGVDTKDSKYGLDKLPGGRQIRCRQPPLLLALSK